MRYLLSHLLSVSIIFGSVLPYTIPANAAVRGDGETSFNAMEGLVHHHDTEAETMAGVNLNKSRIAEDKVETDEKGEKKRVMKVNVDTDNGPQVFTVEIPIPSK